MPFIVAVTVASNSFIVLVLSHRYLRTPTNIVLLAMAVTELLTGLSCLPWLLYYYTFDGNNCRSTKTNEFKNLNLKLYSLKNKVIQFLKSFLIR